jgi:ribonuclease-3
MSVAEGSPFCKPLEKRSVRAADNALPQKVRSFAFPLTDSADSYVKPHRSKPVLQSPRRSRRLEHQPRFDANLREHPVESAVPLEVIEQRINYRFQDQSLLARALVHASIASVRTESNERLEFLGDAILGAIVCDHLYRRFPGEVEGELTKIKSNAVSRRVCAELAVELGLADAVQLGKGMGGRAQVPQSLLAALFESVIGAMYLDSGIEPARVLVLRLLDARIEESARLGHQQNFKSVLQQTLQRRGLGTPMYVVTGEKGPDHAKCFEICVEVGARRYPGCWAMSKKEAEQHAALEALVELGIVTRGEDGEIRLVPTQDS